MIDEESPGDEEESILIVDNSEDEEEEGDAGQVFEDGCDPFKDSDDGEAALR